MEPTLMTDAHGNSFWVTKTFMQPEINLDPASDPLALDVKPKPEPSSVKLEPGTEPDPLDTSMNNVTQVDTTAVEQETDPLALDVKPKPDVFSVKQEPGIESHIPPLDTTINNEAQLESTAASATMKENTDPLALDVKPNPELLPVELESVMPWIPASLPLNIINNNVVLPLDFHSNSIEVTQDTDPLALDVKPNSELLPVKEDSVMPWNPRSQPLNTISNNVLFLDSTSASFAVTQDTDPLALDVKPKPELFSLKLEPGTEPDIETLDTFNNVAQLESTSDSLSVQQESTAPPRSPPRFVPLKRSTRQARSIEPSAMHIMTEAPSDMQDSLPQGILPDSRSAEDQSSSVFNEAPQPAVARSDSTDNQVFDSVCRSDCVDSESRDDDSIQLTSDTSLAVKYNLKQCSVSLRRVSFTHTAPGIVSDRSPFQSSDKQPTSTSRGRKRPRKAPGKSNSTAEKFMCKVCFRTFTAYKQQRLHERNYVKPHFSCDICPRIVDTKSDLEEHHRVGHLKDFSCNLCGNGKIYSTYSSLVAHQQRHSGIRPICSICNKSFSSKVALNAHSIVHDNNKSFTICTVCGNLCSKRGYETHMKTHNKKYICDICGKAFGVKNTLKNHLLKHLNIRDHLCGLCGKSFVKKDLLNYHHKSVHSIVEFHKCGLCGKSFKSGHNFKQHMKNHTRALKCDICGKSFGHKRSLTNHVLQHLKILNYKCDVCGEGFVSLGKVNAHKQRHHLTQRYPCGECDKTFLNKGTLTTHVSRHHKRPSEGPGFPCSCCISNVFSTKEELMNHQKSRGLFCVGCDLICLDTASFHAHVMDVHGSEPKHVCTTCGKCFNSREMVSRHEKTHIETPFQCTHCHKNFATMERRELHVKRNHEIKEYSFDNCPKSFTRQTYLKRHRKSHIKTEQCNICFKYFTLKSSLNRHMSTEHSTEPVTKFSCNICSLLFSTLNALKKHHRRHSKPFKCDKVNCAQSFSDKNQLCRHQEVHISEKTHRCDICEKSFGLMRNLILHKRDHVRRRIHTCHHCGKFYKGKGSLSEHIANIHLSKKLLN